MSVVRQFGSEVIETYLKEKGFRYLVDSDGDYTIAFAYEDDWGCALDVWLLRGGSEREIYGIRVFSDKRIPREDWARVIHMCNTWNRERRWPKASLDIKDSSSLTSKIILEFDIDLEAGIHQELFDDITGTMIAAGSQFWKWAHLEQGL